MGETQTESAAASHVGEYPRVRSYWAYFYMSRHEGLDWNMVPRAMVRVDGWSNPPEDRGSVELTITFTAEASELDPHKVEDLCGLEAELRSLDLPRFWELVEQGRLALIGPDSTRARHPYQLELPEW